MHRRECKQSLQLDDESSNIQEDGLIDIILRTGRIQQGSAAIQAFGQFMVAGKAIDPFAAVYDQLEYDAAARTNLAGNGTKHLEPGLSCG
jgi:hypothetical protein